VRHIVVGVDGSPASRPPLRWAVWLARQTGAAITVVHAVGIPDTAPGGPAAGPDADDARDLEEQAARLVDRLVAESAGTGVEVHRRIVVDHGPARALLEGSAGADLLVLGMRGQGGHPDLKLGSVSRYCTHHAGCPVVIVPPDWKAPAA
jgi:nucleotide-binding universal stress UspA family protein